jgi:hypothetical protein
MARRADLRGCSQAHESLNELTSANGPTVCKVQTLGEQNISRAGSGKLGEELLAAPAMLRRLSILANGTCALLLLEQGP